MDEPMQPRPPDYEAALGAAADVRAPDALRQAVEAAVAEATRPTRARRRPSLGGLGLAVPRPRVLAPVGAALAAAVVALALALSGGGAAAPTVQQAVPVALRTASAPAPLSQPGGRMLAAAVEGVSFPRWEHLGWRAVGQRFDRIGGHPVRTVFYADAQGHRLGYAITGGDALPVSGGRVVRVRGTELRLLRLGGAHVVTWQRDGHTCIVAARDVAPARLVGLVTYEA
jgi:hypothetical protein